MTQAWLGFLRLKLPILLLLLANLIVALLVFDDYGESWDENSIYVYSANTIEAYKAGLSGQELKPFHTGPFNLAYYGPAYFVFSNLAVQVGQSFFPRLNLVDLWHFTYFLSFLVAIISFYSIARRILSPEGALAATLLFNTQPLYWGHAFINPKDIPFMAFFLASIATGLWTVNRLVARPHKFQSWNFEEINTAWRHTSEHTRRNLIAVGVGLLAIIVLLWLLRGVLIDLLGSFLQAGVDSGQGFIWQVAVWLAPRLGEIPISGYLIKANLAYSRFLVFVFSFGNVIWFAAIALSVRGLAKAIVQPFISNLRTLFAFPIVVAGATLGFTMAMRVVAPAAGVLVLWFGWLKLKQRVLAPAISYTLIAVFVCLLLWPYLWEAPLTHFFDSLRQMSDFPIDIAVFFNGVSYRSIDLPMDYFPRLVALQFTLPALIATGFGLALSFSTWLREKTYNTWWLVLAWWLIPLGYIVLFRPTMYDNFRQFLFLTPPIFFFAGKMYEWIRERTGQLMYWLFTAATIVPGLWALITLHPFEYTYYNVLAGESRSHIAAKYETDYWATSYRDAIQFLNGIAPVDAAVYLIGPDHTMRHFGRADLVAAYERASAQLDNSIYDYAILTTRADFHITLFPEASVIYKVEKDGAVYAVVKELK